MTKDLEELLNREAARYNSPDFISADPVQFPRMFSEQRDIEIASLLASTIAWGNRTMICRSANKMFGLMDWQPYNYVMDAGYEELPDGNIHRTFFNRNLKHYLRGLRAIYEKYGTLENFARACGAADAEAPSWHLAEAINGALAAPQGAMDMTKITRVRLPLPAARTRQIGVEAVQYGPALACARRWNSGYGGVEGAEAVPAFHSA